MRKSQLNALINKRMFISIFFVFMALSAAFYAYPRYNIRTPRDIVSVLVFIIVMMINYAMPKRKLLVSKGSRTMLYGLLMFIAFETMCRITGIVDILDPLAYYKYGVHIALTLTLFLSARIIFAYDLKISFLRLVLFPASLVLTISYISHFDGLAFLSTIGQILSVNRYRNSFGFIHVNAAGSASCFFIIITHIYKVALREKGISYRRDMFYMYISLIRIMAVMMALSTGTRTGITSVVLYGLMYVFLSRYSHNSFTANAVFISAIILVILGSFVLVDWWWLIEQSGRLENFRVLANIPLKVWLVGYGYFSAYSGDGVYLMGSLGGKYMDSLYAGTLIRAGLIGFMLFFGSITACILSLFRDIKSMTELQRAAGAFSTIFFYYSLSEATFFMYSWFTFTFWLVLITVINEREAEKQKVFTPYRKHISRYSRYSRKH